MDSVSVSVWNQFAGKSINDFAVHSNQSSNGSSAFGNDISHLSFIDIIYLTLLTCFVVVVVVAAVAVLAVVIVGAPSTQLTVASPLSTFISTMCVCVCVLSSFLFKRTSCSSAFYVTSSQSLEEFCYISCICCCYFSTLFVSSFSLLRSLFLSLGICVRLNIEYKLLLRAHAKKV